MKFEATFSYKLIYVFAIDDNAHKGLLKIGDATIITDKEITEIENNCRELNQAAKKRIDEYTKTAGIDYTLLHTELAVYEKEDKGVKRLKAFRDYQVHQVLQRSGIVKHKFSTEKQGVEWFKIDLETAKNAIKAVKENRKSLNAQEISEDKTPIIFRPEQRKAIEETIKNFKTSDVMLWNAKMRFGKTLSALEVVKRSKYKHVLICTHRPVVNDSWYEDFSKIFYDTNYKYGSKTQGEKIEDLVDKDEPFVYFASIQDLRGSKEAGGKFDKNDYVFLVDWDLLIVDEAHEGTKTSRGQKVLDTIRTNYPNKKVKFLSLSGTPFNLADDFKANEIYTWDYVMEQKEKRNWAINHYGDSNPYEELPQMNIFTYDLNKLIHGYVDVEDSAFNFKEFFRTWTGKIEKDYKPIPEGASIGDFVHEKDVRALLDLMTKKDAESNYPFSTEEYRDYFRHTLWMVPGVKEAKALSALMKAHPVFGSGAFNIANVAGDGDEEQGYLDALKTVRQAIGDTPDETYSITISCGRLTTGVSVPEWTAVFMLAGSFSTSASGYLQTIFRVQTPANINGRIKEKCYVFDFAPDRTLKMVAEAGRLSTRTGDTSQDRTIMGEFLNFCPVISIQGSVMQYYNVDNMLQQLKRAYTERVVKNGFDDKHLYNDNLLKIDEIEFSKFEELKKIIGASKQTKKAEDIIVSDNGLTEEEREKIKKAEKKPQKERTAEELALLEERKKKRENAQKAMSILRGISIRIPLLIYGANVDKDEEITSENFVDKVDGVSWEEFMPKGVTKDLYKSFAKYYEQDVFISAGRQIRKMAEFADTLTPTERVKKIAEIFKMFKNPDKETVLTPWRVVNMHMGDCLGGYNFFDKEYEEEIDEPRYIDQGKVTRETLSNENAKILEINSKTGLYPLYVTYSIFRAKLDKLPEELKTVEKQNELWLDTVKNNVFVICKTKMASSITKRTLLGYKQGKVNTHAFDDLLNQIKEKPQQFKEKITRTSFWNLKENKEMEFDAVVGNPPYQINDGGGVGDSATPIYNLFVQCAKQIETSYISMIMPSRWMKGGKGLTYFREEMINDHCLEKIYDYANSQYCFPNIHIDSGLCYFLWTKSYNDKTQYTYQDLEGHKVVSYRFLKNDISDTIIRDSRQINIVEKSNFNNEKKFNSIVSSRNPYGLFADLFNNPEKYPLSNLSDKYNINSYKVYGVKGIKGGAKRVVGFINKEFVTKTFGVDKYKLLFSKAYMTTSTTPPKVILAKSNEVCTETFLQIGPFDTEIEMVNCKKFIDTKFMRALLFFNRSSLNISNETFELIPLQDFTNNSDIDWSKSIAEIDKQLYAKYNLTEEEINFIETTIKPME